MELLPLRENDIEIAINLFEEGFYFFTSYPKYITAVELKVFLNKLKKKYMIVMNGNIIGLAMYLTYNSKYVFCNLMVKPNSINEVNKELIMKDFIKLIKKEVKEVSRIETISFEFDRSNTRLLEGMGFTKEIEKKNEIYKNDRFWSLYTYTLKDKSIESLINMQLVDCTVTIKRYEEKYKEQLDFVLREKMFLAQIPNEVKIITDDIDSVNAHILQKKLYPFMLCKNEEVIGIISISDLDWENRNGRLVGGLLNRNSDNISNNSLLKAVKEVLGFCKEEIRLKRVWSVLPVNQFKHEDIELAFDIEGKTKNSDMLYVGCVFD